jgi:hypothetical protein
MNKQYYLYAASTLWKGFKAFDGEKPVHNLIYAIIMDNSKANQDKLQEIADMNQEVRLILQLRNPTTGKPVFTTKTNF